MAPRTMTAEHKAAMKAGRDKGRAVKTYLDALEQHRPRRGRQRTPDTIRRRLAGIEQSLPDASSLRRLQLIQERRNLQTELESKAAPTADLSALEAGFTRSAKEYGESKGISYATWRDAGVPADVLKRAGITRGA